MVLRIASFSSALVLGLGAMVHSAAAYQADDKPKPKLVAPTAPTAAAAAAVTASNRRLASGDDKGDDKDKGVGKKAPAFNPAALQTVQQTAPTPQ